MTQPQDNDPEGRPARSRRRARRASLSLRGCFYGSVLLGLGFSVGVVAGSLLEAPRALVERLQGPVQSVELDEPPAAPVGDEPLEEFARLQGERPPSVAAARRDPPAPSPAVPPSVPVAAPPAPRPEFAEEVAAPEPAPSALASRTPPPASPAPEPEQETASGLIVQVAAPRELGEARRLERRLRAAGFDSFISNARRDGVQHYRVRVRPARGQPVRDLAARLEQRGFATWITQD
jgi:cell division septation protein DedD